MPESLRSSDCRLFSDDFLLYCVVNKASDCKLLQQDLTALEKWEATWHMSFNPSKCTVIRVSTDRRHKFQSTYTLHGQTLDAVDGSKYLGVTVTEIFHGPSTSPIQPAKLTAPWDSCEVTLSTAPDKSKQLPILLLLDQSWSMQLLCGTLIDKLI